MEAARSPVADGLQEIVADGGQMGHPKGLIRLYPQWSGSGAVR